jgi:hypothetical protein
MCPLKSNPRNNHVLRKKMGPECYFQGTVSLYFVFCECRRSSLVKSFCVYAEISYVGREGIWIYFYFTTNISSKPHDTLRDPTLGSQSIGKGHCSKGESGRHTRTNISPRLDVLKITKPPLLSCSWNDSPFYGRPFTSWYFTLVHIDTLNFPVTFVIVYGSHEPKHIPFLPISSCTPSRKLLEKYKKFILLLCNLPSAWSQMEPLN